MANQSTPSFVAPVRTMAVDQNAGDLGNNDFGQREGRGLVRPAPAETGFSKPH